MAAPDPSGGRKIGQCRSRWSRAKHSPSRSPNCRSTPETAGTGPPTTSCSTPTVLNRSAWTRVSSCDELRSLRGHLDQLDLWEQRSRQSQAQLAQLTRSPKTPEPGSPRCHPNSSAGSVSFSNSSSESHPNAPSTSPAAFPPTARSTPARPLANFRQKPLGTPVRTSLRFRSTWHQSREMRLVAQAGDAPWPFGRGLVAR